MRQSQQVLEWQREAANEATLDQTRTLLLRNLELKFGSPVPAELVTAIKGQEDLAKLDRWFDTSATAPSLDAFRTAMGL